MKIFYAIPALFLLLGSFSVMAEEVSSEKEEKNISVEDYLQSLSTIPQLFGRKDPFQEVGPPYEAPIVGQSIIPGDDFGPVMGAPVLERYYLADYEVVAVLLGDQYPRALIRLPKEGVSPSRKVVIVKEGDKIGNRKGVVAKITAEGLVAQQAKILRNGFVDKKEMLLKVGGVAEQQKISFSAIESMSVKEK